MSLFIDKKKKSTKYSQEDEVIVKLRKVLCGLSDYILIGILIEEKAENGDTYARMLLEGIRKTK